MTTTNAPVPLACRDCGGKGGYGVSDERGETCGAEDCRCDGGIERCDCGAPAVAIVDGIPVCEPCRVEGERVNALTVAEYAAELGVAL